MFSLDTRNTAPIQASVSSSLTNALRFLPQVGRGSVPFSFRFVLTAREIGTAIRTTFGGSCCRRRRYLARISLRPADENLEQREKQQSTDTTTCFTTRALNT